MSKSVFTKYESQLYPHRFAGELLVYTLAGGTPSDPRVAEAWLRTKLAAKDDLLREMVAEVMAERGVDADKATELVSATQHLNGFRRDDRNGNGLYIEGRQLKACLKEAANVAANAGNLSAKNWGTPDNANYKKGIKAWFPEHVFVIEDRLHLGVKQPTGIMQRFVHARGLSGIQYEEYVENARIAFTVETDHEFSEKEWATIWLTAERQGLGASRSQGYGRFSVVKWEKISGRRKRTA